MFQKLAMPDSIYHSGPLKENHANPINMLNQFLIFNLMISRQINFIRMHHIIQFQLDFEYQR